MTEVLEDRIECGISISSLSKLTCPFMQVRAVSSVYLGIMLSVPNVPIKTLLATVFLKIHKTGPVLKFF